MHWLLYCQYNKHIKTHWLDQKRIMNVILISKIIPSVYTSRGLQFLIQQAKDIGFYQL